MITGISRIRSILPICLLLVCLDLPAAEVRQTGPFLHPLFSDHMVFPRDVEAPVWGWAEPGSKITVSMQGKTAEATTGENGRWQVKLGPFAAGGQCKLSINSPKASLTLDDVLVGDVWLCSGQSNMTLGINEVKNAQEEVANSNHPNLRLFDIPPWLKRAQNCKWFICTPESIVNQSFVVGKGPGRVGFSAAAYFFGRDLQKEIEIPIGLVQTSAPGTPAEAWSSREILSKLIQEEDNIIEAWFKRNDPATALNPNWASPSFDTSAWKTMDLPQYWDNTGLRFDGVVWFRKDFDLPEGWAGKNLILSLGPLDDMGSIWINGELLGNTASCDVPYKLMKSGRNTLAVRVLNTGGKGGFAGTPEQMKLEVANEKGSSVSLAGEWRFQTSRPLREMEAPFKLLFERRYAAAGGDCFNNLIEPLSPFAFKGVVWYQGEANAPRAQSYRKLMTAMIADWRRLFPAGKLPFLIVQLPNFAEGGRPDGLELPFLREAQTEISKSVPDVFMAVAVDIGEEKNQHPKNKQEVGRRLSLKALETVYGKKLDSSGPVFKSMEQNGASLRLNFDHAAGGLTAKDGDLKGFVIAGADGKFVPAKAVIEGGTLVVSSPDVSKPVAVRYGWANWSPCELYNAAGLPAEPFRTDGPGK